MELRLRQLPPFTGRQLLWPRAYPNPNRLLAGLQSLVSDKCFPRSENTDSRHSGAISLRLRIEPVAHRRRLPSFCRRRRRNGPAAPPRVPNVLRLRYGGLAKNPEKREQNLRSPRPIRPAGSLANPFQQRPTRLSSLGESRRSPFFRLRDHSARGLVSGLRR
jgi:hypothetical protein